MVDSFPPDNVPTHIELLVPTFTAIHQLGGSGSIRE